MLIGSEQRVMIFLCRNRRIPRLFANKSYLSGRAVYLIIVCRYLGPAAQLKDRRLAVVPYLSSLPIYVYYYYYLSGI